MSGFERARSRAHHLPSEDATRIILRAASAEERRKIDPFTASKWAKQFNEHYFFAEHSSVIVDDSEDGILIDAVHYAEGGRRLDAEQLRARAVYAAEEVLLDATDERPIALVGARQASGMFHLKTSAAWQEMGVDPANDHTDEMLVLSQQMHEGFEANSRAKMGELLVAAS